MRSMDIEFLSSLLMTCWLTDFFSNMDSGLDSVPGLRKIAAAEVTHSCIFNCSSFLFVIIRLSTAAVSTGLIVSKGQMNYFI